jgi:hypothetical protein
VRHSPQRRFAAKTQPGPDGCIIWTGAVDPTGYGRFSLAGQMLYAHRVAYQWAHGPIPQGLDLDHLCRVRACVNPDHLEAVNRRTNLLRSPLTLTTAHHEGRDCGFANCKNCRRFQPQDAA